MRDGAQSEGLGSAGLAPGTCGRRRIRSATTGRAATADSSVKAHIFELDDMLRLINDAISSYKPILGRTPLNVAGAAWWGNAGQKQLLIAIPPSELAITPGAIVGLLGVQNVKGIPTDFYALKLGDKSDAVLLIDTRGKALTSLPVKISGEAALKGVLTPVHIYTSQGGLGQPLGISISLCIGVHEPNCKCSGIYIQF